MTGILHRKGAHGAAQHRTNSAGGVVRVGSTFSSRTLTSLEVIDADTVSRIPHRVGAGKPPPGFIHRSDETSGIEQRNTCRKRVENSGLLCRFPVTCAPPHG